MKKYIILLVLITYSVLSAQENNLSVTVYNDNLGIVNETRNFDLQKGVSEIEMTDVAQLIDPTSVKVNFNGTLIEQNYQYDLVSLGKILNKYIDKQIKLIHKDGTFIEGSLLSSFGGQAVVKQQNGGLMMINNLDDYRIAVDALPEGLKTKPTLVWKVDANKAGNQKFDVSYHTSGFRWNAEYVAVLNEENNKIDLKGWFNINNNSGKTYKDAKLKLIAGDVNRTNKLNIRGGRGFEVDYVTVKSNESTVSEKQLFEYHMYTVNFPTTLANNEEKQISLLEANNIDVTKKLIYSDSYNHYSSGNKVGVYITFDNKKENNLGMPLPKGRVRVNQKDGDGMEFIGEDNIDHTPDGEDVTLKLGKAFDVTADEIVVNREKISNKVFEYEYEITFKNGKDTPVTLEVYRDIGMSNWKVLKNSLPYEKVDAATIKFNVEIPAKGETVLTYKYRTNNN